MAKTRKTKSKESGETNAPASKKTKLEEPQVDGLEVRFEWEGDKSKWVRYAKRLNKSLCDAFNAGKKQIQLKVPTGALLTVVFDKMIQKNSKTGWERKVRVAVKNDKESDYYVWEWQDDTTQWCPYTVPLSVELEKAFQGGLDSLTTSSKPSSFEMDLKNMTQTNVKTKFSRSIRRTIKESETPSDYEVEVDVQNENASATKEEINEEEEEDVPKPKSGRGRKGKSGSSAANGSGRDPTKSTEEINEEEKEDVPKPKSGRGRKGKSGSSAAKGSGRDPTKSTVKTVVVKKGSAPVDDLCPIASSSSVHESNRIIWDCMLNQTNISNNNNKYYLIQLLQDSVKNSYHVWQRWGRVGYNGQTNLVNCGTDLEAAMKVFIKKFKDKTGNDWSCKDSFDKVPGKYDLLKMDYSAEVNGQDQVDAPKVKEEGTEETQAPDSKLDQKVQDLIQLICDVKSMEDAVIEMKYDAKKAPLGKLTKAQIKAGYSALKEIEGLIEKKDFGRNLSDACSEFYTRIPHEFGMQTPPLIRTPQMVKQKIELLEALEDIEIAIKMLKGGDMTENPIDRHYHQLHCGLEPVNHTADEFKLVKKYLEQTHASTHNQYKLELLDLFKCDKEDQDETFIDYGNRMLLWHGSRLTNWAGILGQGLRIAPPEAPVTGYMFGKGVYFADMSSKSANYCFATKTKNTGLLLLCDVSLGTTNDKLAADYTAAKLPKGKHSVKGVGRVAPDPKTYVTLPDGLTVPVGKGIDVGSATANTLNYNEFIVYDTRQIRMKYLVKVKFNFK
ncbi:unnamed protein product [Lymnaea stagnalis]|uniref:Poly [ADP-ribose] polymerase n=1 Tax=Lymnaea stagnalis TaxID=6523 RepID=A0AAV2HHP4_LYMST